MRIYNSLGRALQEFEPQTAGQIGIYVCGATVQSEPHLGHGRYAVVFDVVRRYFDWVGFDVRYVRNVTDVDDKIIAAANERGVSPVQIVDEASHAFVKAYAALRVQPPDIEPRATDHIAEMIALVERLVESGHAYEAGGDVYFSVRGFDGYGELSGRDVDELRVGARVEPGRHKRDPLDFALWKAAKPGEPSWPSPWGDGRPGWHIECSAMAEKYLGFGFDIHGGGNDLVFPHHENEIAQSEAAAGRSPFARVWMHNGMMTLGGEKMAKSTGHIIDLQDLLETYPPLAVRLFYLRTHYRKPLEFTPDALEDAVGALERLWSFRRRVPGPVDAAADVESIRRFNEAMADDFDAAGALAVVFDVVRSGHRALDAGGDASTWASTYDELIDVFGLAEPIADLDDVADELAALARDYGVSDRAPSVVDTLVVRRDAARGEKDWATADEIRDRLASLRIVIEDRADGSRWHRT